ncbi:MAG: hypothetical protein RL011_1746 [Pseudomonadota bacterium]|jgi:hypothetical protein
MLNKIAKLSPVALVLFVSGSVAQGQGSASPGYIGGGPALHSVACMAHNRDGTTCYAVGYREGQVGTPWGPNAGVFSCTNGCLRWVGPGK